MNKQPNVVFVLTEDQGYPPMGAHGHPFITILVFMSDNGQTGVSERWNGMYMGGMRGIKGSPYEGGHRVPFFVRWPAGGYDQSRVVPDLASYVDFMPTLLDLCGVTVPADRTFHGRSLVPLMRGETDPREAGHSISGGIDGRDIDFREDGIEPGTAWMYSGGQALGFDTACLNISGHPQYYMEVHPGDAGVVCAVKLTRGAYRIWAQLATCDGTYCAAYYLYVRRCEI